MHVLVVVKNLIFLLEGTIVGTVVKYIVGIVVMKKPLYMMFLVLCHNGYVNGAN